MTHKKLAHAVAFHLPRNGKYRFFDPNFGDFEFDKIEELMTKLSTIAKTYIKLFKVTKLEAGWCCWE